jgi:hypothetical protein
VAGGATIIVALAVHAYIDTRPKPATPSPQLAMTPLDVILERSTYEKVVYKSKVRVVLSNNTGRNVDVMRPTWIAEHGDVPIQRPLGSTFQVESAGGTDVRRLARRDERSPCGRRWVFRTWIGLDPFIQ